jgi:PadR family transcriptional regulator, regulatory protein AphA
MDQLSATAKVILGMLAMRPRSGYEIKGFVDRSTRFFWAASYGQIYPELRRLSEAGLIEGTDSPTGGRQRTIYELTRAGWHELETWHSEPAEHFDYRDEAMLKLFFAGAVAPKRAAEIARERAEQAAEVADTLRAVEAGVPGDDQASYSVLRFGIDFNQFIADWFERQALAFDEGVPLAKLPVPENPEEQEEG